MQEIDRLRIQVWIFSTFLEASQKQQNYYINSVKIIINCKILSFLSKNLIKFQCLVLKYINAFNHQKIFNLCI